MVDEAPLRRADDGALLPDAEGWFVLNVADARWLNGDFGFYTRFENREKAPFQQVGINIGVLAPGQPACMYHGEDEQEDFLVLAGEALLLVEGQERALKQWDFVHCPPWTEHVFVGAGDGPCTILALGTRLKDDVVYPASELAQRHNAGVKETTRSPQEAYADNAEDVPAPFDPSWLPG